jgi:hypothetical protein
MALDSSQGSGRVSFCLGKRGIAEKVCIAVARHVKYSVAAKLAVVELMAERQAGIHAIC